MRRALHARHRLVQRPPRHAKRRRADGRTEHVQHRHRQLEPVARLADQRVFRQHHILQRQPCQRMRRDGLQPFGHAQPRHIGRHQEGRQALRARRLAGAGEDHIDIRDAAVRNPGLFAVQHASRPGTRAAVVAVAATSEPEPGSVRAKAEIARALARPLQPAPLRGGAEQRHRPHAQPLHGKGEIGQPVVPRQGLADQAQRADIQPLALAGAGMPQPAARPKCRHQPPAGGIDIVVIHRQMRRAPASSAADRSRWRSSKNGQSR